METVIWNFDWTSCTSIKFKIVSTLNGINQYMEYLNCGRKIQKKMSKLSESYTLESPFNQKQPKTLYWKV